MFFVFYYLEITASAFQFEVFFCSREHFLKAWENQKDNDYGIESWLFQTLTNMQKCVVPARLTNTHTYTLLQQHWVLYLTPYTHASQTDPHQCSNVHIIPHTHTPTLQRMFRRCNYEGTVTPQKQTPFIVSYTPATFSVISSTFENFKAAAWNPLR